MLLVYHAPHSLCQARVTCFSYFSKQKENNTIFLPLPLYFTNLNLFQDFYFQKLFEDICACPIFILNYASFFHLLFLHCLIKPGLQSCSAGDFKIGTHSFTCQNLIRLKCMNSSILFHFQILAIKTYLLLIRIFRRAFF